MIEQDKNDAYDEEDIYDAVIAFRKTHRDCQVCGKTVAASASATCDHPKNGYCAYFRLQSEIDKVKFGMKKPCMDVNV